MVERLRKVEHVAIPDSFSYRAIPQLRREAQEKLERVQPRTLGQAGRVSGITPADLSVLLLYLNDPDRSTREQAG